MRVQTAPPVGARRCHRYPTAYSASPPQVRWTKTAGSASDKFQETSIFNETLRIQRIQRVQGGRYYCKAENGVGVAAIKSIRVDVQCKLHPHPHFPGMFCGSDTRPRASQEYLCPCSFRIYVLSRSSRDPGGWGADGYSWGGRARKWVDRKREGNPGWPCVLSTTIVPLAHCPRPLGSQLLPPTPHGINTTGFTTLQTCSC